MTHRGQVLEPETGIRAGESLPSTRDRAARATLESQERFVAYVAHELRGPIALQRTLVEVALADPNADVATLRHMGESVVASCVGQQRLIEALLDLVRGRRGLTRHEPVDISVIAADVLGAHDLSGLGSAATLEPAWTTGDPDLIERLAANLVSNAIRHNIVGGWIELATWAEPRRALLSVTNTGPMVPVDELQRLFQPFQRLESRSFRGAVGDGLGLAIVRAIAEAHDAVVSAEVQPGGGLRVDLAFRRMRIPRGAR